MKHQCKCGNRFTTQEKLRAHRKDSCWVVAREREEARILREARERHGLTSSFNIAKAYLREHDAEAVVPWREASKLAEQLKRAS